MRQRSKNTLLEMTLFNTIRQDRTDKQNSHRAIGPHSAIKDNNKLQHHNRSNQSSEEHKNEQDGKTSKSIKTPTTELNERPSFPCKALQRGTKFVQVIFENKQQGKRCQIALQKQQHKILKASLSFKIPALRNTSKQYRNHSGGNIHHPHNLKYIPNIEYLRIHNDAWSLVANIFDMPSLESIKPSSQTNYENEAGLFRACDIERQHAIAQQEGTALPAVNPS